MERKKKKKNFATSKNGMKTSERERKNENVFFLFFIRFFFRSVFFLNSLKVQQQLGTISNKGGE